MDRKRMDANSRRSKIAAMAAIIIWLGICVTTLPGSIDDPQSASPRDHGQAYDRSATLHDYHGAANDREASSRCGRE